MRRYLIFCALVLTACGPDPAVIPAELLDPCPGWQGKRPETEGQLIRAALAEKGGRLCANSKLASIARLQ